MRKTRAILVLAAILLLAVGIINAADLVTSTREGLQLSANAPARPAEATIGATYVGSVVCSGCHKDHYEGWKATYHPYKIQDASEYTVIGDFFENNELTVGGHTIKMSTSDDTSTYYVTTMGADSNEHTYEIKYTIGGFWKQRYITEFENGELHILPVQWNIETKEWVDYHGLSKVPGEGSYWSDRGRIWQIKCGGCHTTGLEINYDAETDTFASTWVDSGAGCEACHGPGSDHVDAGGYGKTINPRLMPDKRKAAMVCGQCHNRGGSKVAAEAVPDGPSNYGYAAGPAGFKPGLDLARYYNAAPGLWPDGTSKKHHQQYNDYLKSTHFEEGVVCWDCHDLHSPAMGTKYATKGSGDMVCIECHPQTGTPSLTHSIHDFGSCVGCHMPQVAKTAVAYDIHSHTGDVIVPQTTIDQGGLANQPNSCNACKYHENDTPQALDAALDALK